jgi:hypothetical protein
MQYPSSHQNAVRTRGSDIASRMQMGITEDEQESAGGKSEAIWGNK